MPFQLILWTPVYNQKINQTQKLIYTLHLIHSSIAFNTQFIWVLQTSWTLSLVSNERITS